MPLSPMKTICSSGERRRLTNCYGGCVRADFWRSSARLEAVSLRLVRSGLIPSLYSGFMVTAGSSWRVATMRPGEDPIHHLAAALDYESRCLAMKVN